MEKDFWQQKWQEQNIHWHQQEINAFLQEYIERLQLKQGDTVLVPLCGKTNDMIWLAEQGYRVIGVELSDLACNDFFRERNINPCITQVGTFTHYQHENIDIYCGDIFDLTRDMLPPIHAVFDCRALVALPDAMRVRYVQHLQTCFAANTRILLLTIESSGVVQGPPFSIHADIVNDLFGATCRIELLKRVLYQSVPAHLTTRGYRDFIECAYLLEMNGT